jgi:hypothetical protein
MHIFTQQRTASHATRPFFAGHGTGQKLQKWSEWGKHQDFIADH